MQFTLSEQLSNDVCKCCIMQWRRFVPFIGLLTWKSISILSFQQTNLTATDNRYSGKSHFAKQRKKHIQQVIPRPAPSLCSAMLKPCLVWYVSVAHWLAAVPSSLLPTYIHSRYNYDRPANPFTLTHSRSGVARRLEYPSRTGNKQNRPTHFIVVSFKRNAPVFVMVPLRAWTDSWLHHHPSSVECSPPPRGNE